MPESKQPDREQIEKRAHELFIGRGGGDDDGFSEHGVFLPIISERIIGHPWRALQAAPGGLSTGT